MRYRGIELDPFQVEAIEAIERHDTVVVAAPTGAGKTVIAEYAIERYLREDRRIIYTAPVKALSNQKFRDFGAAWGDHIGIVTGDVSINSTAPVLIMTTEIFRNTVFDDPERLHDVEYVIFDEIHYINDAQRGTVWEESLIFAPPHIGFVCLSATIPNLDEFAGWLREIRPDLPVTVIGEAHRPVPLEHHLWIPGIGEAKRADLERLGKAAERKQRRLEPREVRRALGAGKRDSSGSGDLVLHLRERDRLPCLYFCFARQACESNAARYAGAGLLDGDERERMLELYDMLRERFGLTEDVNAERMHGLLAGGVAFHHAGMLPMLKEVVERIFSTGLLKLLFTTETFAVGVNMPAKTVAFESLEKYDGVETRYLLTREYQQMAGRAGRRGIDDMGYVYARLDPAYVDADEVLRMLDGEVEPTRSQFNLSYSSILSLYAKHGEGIYEVAQKSFATYQNRARLDELADELSQLDAVDVPLVDCFKDQPKAIRKYLEAKEELHRAHGRLQGDRQRLLRRMRNARGGERRRLQAELDQVERPVRRLEDQIQDSICHQCRNKKACTKVQEQINSHRQRVERLTKQVSSLRHFQRDQIGRRLTLLREFGYIDEMGLTPKGEMAASLYGFELPITELFYAGFFENVDEIEIGCLMVAIVYESKRSAWYRKVRNGDLKLYLREASQLLREIERREYALGIEGGTEPLDDALSMAAVTWLTGGSLEDVHEHTDASDGDIVRALRHAVDLLRQFRRCLDDYPALRDRVERTVHRMRRDEVDAERQLRLGHELDEAAAEAMEELGEDDAVDAEPEPVGGEAAAEDELPRSGMDT